MTAPEEPEIPAPATPATAPQEDVEAAEARPLIREWHTMTAGERAAEWQALVGWVVWIHDLYELSRTERLPRCWPQHPGLVEELRSLKAWREHIYDTPGTAATPHTARSWHGELRQSIAAATGFWAPGCRVGHQGTDLLATTQPLLPAQWAKHGPPVMDSAPQPEQHTNATMTAEAMHTALTDGTARRHSPGLPTAAHYDNAWWQRNDDSTWTRDDDQHAADLERSSQQLRDADAAYDRHINREDQQ